MTVRVVPWVPNIVKKAGESYTGPKRWRVDIRFKKTDGSKVRDQKIHEAPTKRMAQKWGEAREAQLRDGSLVVKVETKIVPAWDVFFPRFLEHCEGERLKPSYLASVTGAHRVWLSPAFGSLTLDKITDERVSALRSKMAKAPGKVKGSTLSPKRVNNCMSVLLGGLKLALKWKVIDSMPCTVEIPSVHGTRPDFYDVEDHERLCEGASKVGSHVLVLVLLGAAAGLRRGEMMALRWTDCDFKRRQIRIEQAAWVRSAKEAKRTGTEQIVIGKPKGGRGRVIPMTQALASGLQAHRHLRGEFVLSLDDGSLVRGHILRDWLEAAQRRAGMPVMGALHKLRHTFCSHLAMKGAPVRAIQELAGHANITTTMRYMHLSPSTLDAAIRLLDKSEPVHAAAE